METYKPGKQRAECQSHGFNWRMQKELSEKEVLCKYLAKVRVQPRGIPGPAGVGLGTACPGQKQVRERSGRGSEGEVVAGEDRSSRGLGSA